MSSSKQVDSVQRLNVLRKLLSEGQISTQEELAQELRRQSFEVTQSTISRDLRRLGAIKALDVNGRTVYRLPDAVSVAPALTGGSVKEMILDIRHNGSLIVIHTTPGSASLIARHLDQTKPQGILGTIAGGDAIFVAPEAMKRIEETMQAILDELP